jgi:hypothetical protein
VSKYFTVQKFLMPHCRSADSVTVVEGILLGYQPVSIRYERRLVNLEVRNSKLRGVEETAKLTLVN